MRWEQIGAVSVLTDTNCTIQTDALLLARFATPHAAERVCDLGTGCGTMPAVWLNDAGFYGTVTGVERNEQAVAICSKTIEKNRLSSRFTLLKQDWNDLTDRTFDRVVCNPPYFAVGTGATNLDRLRNEARHEKEDHPLEAVLEVAARLLQTGGRFDLCHKPERLCEVFEKMRRVGIEPKRLQMVHHTPDTPAWLFLCEGRRNAHPGLTVLPTLINGV